ncbi:MAG: hypothetical protein ACKO34_02465 [Vampirovibrionales bacterium]
MVVVPFNKTVTLYSLPRFKNISKYYTTTTIRSNKKRPVSYGILGREKSEPPSILRIDPNQNLANVYVCNGGGLQPEQGGNYKFEEKENSLVVSDTKNGSSTVCSLKETITGERR